MNEWMCPKCGMVWSPVRYATPTNAMTPRDLVAWGGWSPESWRSSISSITGFMPAKSQLEEETNETHN